jgi:hypothetical protein
MIKDVDMTVPHNTLDALLGMPRAKQHARWNSMTRMFHLAKWLLMVTVMIMFPVIVLHLTNYGTKYSKEQPNCRSMPRCLSNS